MGKFISSLFVIICLSCSAAFSHALWIETASTGKKGAKQDVFVYYGEYAQGERDALDKWYADVKDLKLWLIQPDGSKQELSLNRADNRLETSFVPESDGLYLLSVAHKASELANGTQYEFLTSAQVQVGKGGAELKNAYSPLDFSVYASSADPKTNKVVELQAFREGKPFGEGTVAVFSPKGWSLELTTDAEGKARFTPLWPGRYVVETSKFSQEAGEHGGQAYQAFWQGATNSFEVK